MTRSSTWKRELSFIAMTPLCSVTDCVAILTSQSLNNLPKTSRWNLPATLKGQSRRCEDWKKTFISSRQLAVIHVYLRVVIYSD
ncbi:hypothetical protein BDV39DRAFT_174154 [Aspergillus sergii]|uniref:Uncharacterized protein n=1 Tax=Aspergillus sergii TaxID=1034303 RepID=A0A5N6X4S0_9EURO|nr:hypothetical protein BDV39DRAFT_174154 [Aspergillus sergii]